MSMLIFWALAAASAAAPPAEPIVELSHDEEVQLALGAAPERLRDGAGVFILGPKGYVRARESTNGFNCIVSREPHSGVGPECFDREGSRTSLLAQLMRGRLQREARTDAEIEASIDRAYKAGTLKPPRKAGIVYMLSTHFHQLSPKTGKDECIFPPHMMFYAPYLTNRDIGAEKSFGSTREPWILNEGKPEAMILVVDRSADDAACQ